MKVFINIMVTVIGLFIPFQIYLSMLNRRSRKQSYDVVHSEKDFEIRFYPSVTMATVTSTSRSYEDMVGSGFKKLSDYIFGDNDARLQLAMIHPVHMDINESLSTMSFVLPTQFNKEDMPAPNNQHVTLMTTPDEYVAAIKFGGYASDSDFQLYAEKLENSLWANSIFYYSNFRYLAYDRPYQLLGRRNEIIVSVNWHS